MSEEKLHGGRVARKGSPGENSDRVRRDAALETDGAASTAALELPNEVCEAALAALLLTGFLVQLSDGAYVRDRVQRTNVDRVESVGRAS